jgi:hypothetical protein
MQPTKPTRAPAPTAPTPPLRKLNKEKPMATLVTSLQPLAQQRLTKNPKRLPRRLFAPLQPPQLETRNLKLETHMSTLSISPRTSPTLASKTPYKQSTIAAI